jgi:hypothetical protein
MSRLSPSQGDLKIRGHYICQRPPAYRFARSSSALARLVEPSVVASDELTSKELLKRTRKSLRQAPSARPFPIIVEQANIDTTMRMSAVSSGKLVQDGEDIDDRH